MNNGNLIVRSLNGRNRNGGIHDGVENNEGVALQFSVNDGSSWVEAKYCLNGDGWLVNKS
jgi:hypothetical protein